MRVLLTTDTVGGVWTYTRELTAGLLEAGCSVGLVSFGEKCRDDQSAWCQATLAVAPDRFQFWQTTIPLEWMQGNARAYIEGVPSLQQAIDHWRPDLLHSNQFCFGSVPGTLPRLVVAHSDVLSWAEACRPEGLERSEWLTRYTELVQAGLSRAHAVVAPTSWMLAALRRNFRLPPTARVIANGRSLPANAGLEGRRLQAVTAGRLWDPAKNAAQLQGIRSVPTILAGATAAPESSGSASAPLSEAALLTLFRQSAIYVATSIYEPFGLAPLEAALCGCALVAHDIPTFREVWEDAALFFRSTEELESHLLALSTDAHLLSTMQARALRRAERYSREAMTASYLGLYKELLRMHGQPAGGGEQTLATIH